MSHYPNYSAPPTQPFRLPISDHPATSPCGPGRSLAKGAFVSRGGVFEGPAMARGDEHCGYWSDHIGDVSLWQQSYPMSYPTPEPMGIRVVRPYPPETRARFQPRSIMLGFPPWTYGMTNEQPGGALAFAGGVPGPQRLDPMSLNINRRRHIWTGPLNDQADWPDSLSPRGGVLDGNTIAHRGQDVYSAYYDGPSPHVMLPEDRVDVLPNPLDARPVPAVGWGIPGTPRAMIDYPAPTPAMMRRNYGAQEATKPAMIARGDQSATQPRPVCGCSGTGPDGLGATPVEWGRGRRARVRARMRARGYR